MYIGSFAIFCIFFAFLWMANKIEKLQDRILFLEEDLDEVRKKVSPSSDFFD